MPKRFAIYYAPEPDSDLERFGRCWLGREVQSDQPVDLFNLPGISPEEQLAMTASPKHYGFHGTLKAPFALADGKSEDDLEKAVHRLAIARIPFNLPFLKLTWLDDFLALTVLGPCRELHELASDTVQVLDEFRAPLSEEKIRQYQAVGLSARQKKLLNKWGYPYVMDEFRFHLTLTTRVKDQDFRQRILEAVRPLVLPLFEQEFTVSEICLFEQPDLDAPFVLTRRFPFNTNRQ